MWVSTPQNVLDHYTIKIVIELLSDSFVERTHKETNRVDYDLQSKRILHILGLDVQVY